MGQDNVQACCNQGKRERGQLERDRGMKEGLLILSVHVNHSAGVTYPDQNPTKS